MINGNFRSYGQGSWFVLYCISLGCSLVIRDSKAVWFTKLDIVVAFNRIRMAAGEEWITAFCTRLGLFEYLVIPFGLANAPSIF